MGIDLRISTSTIRYLARNTCIPINIIPEEFIIAYDHQVRPCNGFVYFGGRGMYGLPQAGRVANEALVKQLAVADYHPTGLTHGLFQAQNQLHHVRLS
jgi:hypothetical protein